MKSSGEKTQWKTNKNKLTLPKVLTFDIDSCSFAKSRRDAYVGVTSQVHGMQKKAFSNSTEKSDYKKKYKLF